MRHLDLFSGIGGFALAASWAWPKHEVAAFCDIDTFAHKVLNKHWPNVPIINDVRNINKETVHGTIDLVTGGFPCQPFSQAGKRKGTDDDRYLWPEMHRIIAEFRPRWVLGENVSGLFTIEDGMAFERVCSDLEASGYEVWPLRIPACATGAPHRRDRWWFVAYPNRNGQHGSNRQDGIVTNQAGVDALGDVAEGFVVTTDNATNPQRLQRGGRRCQQQYDDQGRPLCESISDNGDGVRGKAELCYTRTAGNPGDTDDIRRREVGKNPDNNADPYGGNQWSRHWLEVATAFCRVDDGIPGQLDRDRKHRLKALGNAIVPQVAYQIMQAMKAHDEFYTHYDTR